MINPARQLEGLTLEGGWKVGNLIELSPSATGGYFSVGYVVESQEGKKAFLKALDFSDALRSPDPAKALLSMVASFNFECEILEKCKEKRFDRVVQAITHGKTQIGESADGVVQYLIFELADRDIRSQIDFSKKFETAWALRSLHHIGTGLQQLHSQNVAHQDLKPSNVLIFNGTTSKVSDLGRASFKGRIAPHEDLAIAGDSSYAPPELLYGYIDPDWNRRRFGCDLYLLGSMIVFFFTGMSMTSLLLFEMHEEHRWGKWGGTFDEVLPYLRDGFGRVINNLKMEINLKTEAGLKELLEIVRQLCDPDPRLRGDPKSRIGIGNLYSLQRYVSQFNLLASKAECGILN